MKGSCAGIPREQAHLSEKVFESQERVSGFQRKGLTSREVRELPGKFGELPGKFGKLPGNLWIAVKFHSERTSGEVAEKLPGKFGELPGKSGDFPEARGSLIPSQRLAKFVSKPEKIRTSQKIAGKVDFSEPCPLQFTQPVHC